ncbi:death-associated inhibitor of apoptosis 2 [Condylostylus longicornis]|uniref:death-associated inhibitor of apoptosis 2 n=1 Tax=Condylostylus longicornis TaxID=2530218 RepID=UPI00244E2977|nr:death-associated inhibitor of apoptosis 2 [Condylostylus longicornis]
MAATSSTTSVADNYNYEKNRLKSFQLWPCPNIVNPNELAKCGFYSTGFYMETQCNWCHITISDWQPNDQIMERHMDADPFCQFITNRKGCGNIPLENDRISEMNNISNSENASSSTTSENAEGNMTIASSSSNIVNSSTNNIMPGKSFNNVSTTSSSNDNTITHDEEQRHQLRRQQSQINSNPNSLDLRLEHHRLATFKNWPNPNISPQSLAKAGFYYFNKSDQVKCAWCKGVIAQWEKGDNAFQEHDRFFPDCPRVQLGPLIEVTCERSTLDDELGIQQISAPKSTKYSCLDARMRTYARWPIPEIQNPEILAQAGFYYQEIEDQVRCFHCNGGLRSWQEEDDPWFEHAKWFPYCNFLKLVKGPNFVSQISGTNKQQQQQSQIDGRNGHGNTSNCITAENNQGQQQFRQTTVTSEPTMTLDEAMQLEPVQRALEMGLNEGRIMSATRRQLEAHGKPFDTTEELVEAVLEGQVDEEDDANGPEPSSSIVREVSRILNNIFNPRNQSTATADTSDYDFDDIGEFHGIGEGSSSIIPQNENLNRLNNRPRIELSSAANMDQSSEVTSTVSCDHNNSTNNEISSNHNCSNTSNINRDNIDSTLNEDQQQEDQQEANIEENSSLNNSESNQTKTKPKLNEQLSLEEENRKLKDARTCKVCMDDEVGVVFLPCGHLVTCVQCAPGVTVCPLCRSGIKGYVRTFLS